MLMRDADGQRAQRAGSGVGPTMPCVAGPTASGGTRGPCVCRQSCCHSPWWTVARGGPCAGLSASSLPRAGLARLTSPGGDSTLSFVRSGRLDAKLSARCCSDDSQTDTKATRGQVCESCASQSGPRTRRGSRSYTRTTLGELPRTTPCLPGYLHHVLGDTARVAAMLSRPPTHAASTAERHG
jgi:hypothetical protein